MNRRIKAKKQVNTMLHHHFKYLFVENAIDLNTIHLTFQMDSKSHNLQMYGLQISIVTFCVLFHREYLVRSMKILMFLKQ